MRDIMKISAVASVLLLLVSAGVGAQANKQAVDAFNHYEAIRVTLSKDAITDVAKHAAALAPLAGAVAGKEAEAAANRLRTAKTLNQARDEFGALSQTLVPKFLEAKVPGVTGYACSMKSNAVWAQRGTAIENPYFGKVMLNCGAPLR
jgi:hypothetical protein